MKKFILCRPTEINGPNLFINFSGSYSEQSLVEYHPVGADLQGEDSSANGEPLGPSLIFVICRHLFIYRRIYIPPIRTA